MVCLFNFLLEKKTEQNDSTSTGERVVGEERARFYLVAKEWPCNNNMNTIQ